MESTIRGGGRSHRWLPAELRDVYCQGWGHGGFNHLTLTNDNTSVLALNLSYLFEQHAVLEESMARLLGWLEEGKLVPPPVKSFPLDAVADAHRALESGGTVGKLVLVP